MYLSNKEPRRRALHKDKQYDYKSLLIIHVFQDVLPTASFYLGLDVNLSSFSFSTALVKL